MIVLDASAVIAFLYEQDLHHAAAVRLLEDPGPWVASVVTMAEVLVLPTKQGRLAAAERVVADLGVRTMPLTSAAATGLADLRATTRLRMPDCCVLLTALEHGGRVATFDARLAEQAGVLGLQVVGG